jgi:uncharacterized tellurite resistance protein B-like protein
MKILTQIFHRIAAYFERRRDTARRRALLAHLADEISSDGIVTDSELDAFVRRQKELGLSDNEARQAKLRVYSQVLKSATRDRRLDDEESAMLEKLEKTLGIPAPSVRTQKALARC